LRRYVSNRVVVGVAEISLFSKSHFSPSGSAADVASQGRIFGCPVRARSFGRGGEAVVRRAVGAGLGAWAFSVTLFQSPTRLRFQALFGQLLSSRLPRDEAILVVVALVPTSNP